MGSIQYQLAMPIIGYKSTNESIEPPMEPSAEKSHVKDGSSNPPLSQVPTTLSPKSLAHILCKPSQFTTLNTKQVQYQHHSLQYSDLPSDLLKWIRSYSREGTKEMAQFIENISVCQDQANFPQMRIQKDILRSNNFLGKLIRKGFLVYLFKKYQLNNSTENHNFRQEFGRDIKWFKKYLSKVIVSVYGGWVTNAESTLGQFEDMGVVNILTQLPQWEIIYAVYNKCLPKYRLVLSKEDIEEYFKPIINKTKEGVDISNIKIPFENTIEFLKQFSETQSISKKLEQLSKLDRLLTQEMEQLRATDLKKSEMDEEKRLKHLEYCIYSSKKEIVKSVFYIRDLLGEDEIDTQPRLRESKYILRSLYNASYTFLSDYYSSYNNLDSSQKYIEFKLPAPSGRTHLPFQISSIYIQEIFSTTSSTCTLFSKRPLIPQSFVTILFTSPQNDLTLGVCSKELFLKENQRLTDSAHSIVFNTSSRKTFHNNTTVKYQNNSHIHRVTLRIKSETELEWVVNDSSTITHQYSRIVSSMDQLFACITFSQGTEFRIIHF